MAKNEPTFRGPRARATRLYVVPLIFPTPAADHSIVVRASSRAAAYVAAFVAATRDFGARASIGEPRRASS